MCSPILFGFVVLGLVLAVFSALDARFRFFFRLTRQWLQMPAKWVGWLLSRGILGWVFVLAIVIGIGWYIAENPDSIRDTLECVGMTF